MLSNRRYFLGIISTFLICFCTHAAVQKYELREINLTRIGRNYRIKVQCNGPVTYESIFKDATPGLKLYVLDAILKLQKQKMHYLQGPVKGIKAIQWKKSPAIVEIFITFDHVVPYKVKKGDPGIIYIDLIEDNDSLIKNSKTSVITNVSLESTSLNETSSTRKPDLLSSQELLSLDVREAEISSVLRLLAKQSNLNIITSQDVTGKVTVSLSNVTVKDALDNIVRANGYDYIVAGEVIVVKPMEKFQVRDLQTKIYRLKYVDATNLKSALSQILSKRAKIQVFYQDFHLAEGEKAVGQTKDKKKRSSMLIVTDTPNNIQQVDALVAELDVPTAQIMIEVKLIEIAPRHEDKLGIDWSKTINAQIFQEVLLPSGKTNRFSAEVPINGGSINYGTLSFSQYNAVIDFLNSYTKSKLISNPRILAMDNQEAVISVGTTVPIPQINRGVGGQGDVVTFDYREVNISLRVTPHVGDDSTITLFVNPVIEEITGEVVAGENRAPITSKREVETVVKVKSNETIVIGGLIKENTIETLDKVWLLGDVPLIGNLFRHKERSKQQTDLLIFITPRLLE